MVKIEQLKNGAKASIIRDGKRIPLFLHQLISRQDLETMEVFAGTVVYSIDESEILEMSAPAPKTVPTPAEVAQQPPPRLSAKEIAKAAKQKQTEE